MRHQLGESSECNESQQQFIEFQTQLDKFFDILDENEKCDTTTFCNGVT